MRHVKRHVGAKARLRTMEIAHRAASSDKEDVPLAGEPFAVSGNHDARVSF